MIAEHGEENRANLGPSCSAETAFSSGSTKTVQAVPGDGDIVRGLHTTGDSEDGELNVNTEVTVGISGCWPRNPGRLSRDYAGQTWDMRFP